MAEDRMKRAETPPDSMRTNELSEPAGAERGAGGPASDGVGGTAPFEQASGRPEQGRGVGAKPPGVGVDALRRRIDAIDQRLVQLLNERAGCALEIGRHKEGLGLPIYQPMREAEVLSNVRAGNRGPLDDGAMTRLFERIIDEARRLERLAGEKHEPSDDRPIDRSDDR